MKFIKILGAVALSLLSSNSFADGRIKDIDIYSDAQIAFTKTANIATHTFLGNSTGSTGHAAPMSVATAAGLLGVPATAFNLSYTPTIGGNWSVVPANVGDALDNLAARTWINQLNGDVSAGPGGGNQTATVNSVGGKTAAAVATSVSDTQAATSANTVSTIVKRDISGNFSAGTITASLSGNASTATALASNPTDCGANTYATTIDAQGNLTCATVTDAGLATPYIKADGTRSLSADWNAGAHSITATGFIGALTGNASTASAFDHTPTACSAGNYVTAQSSTGALTCSVPPGTGVTSVALTTPAWLTVAGSPITTAGTLAVTATTGQTANQFLATPNGSTGAVGLRSIVAADIPTLNQSTSGNAATASAFDHSPTACSANQYATQQSTTGAFTCAQVGYAQVTGTPTLHYQTVQANTTPVTQRTNLNFGPEFTLADSAGSDRSTVDIASAGVTNAMMANSSTTVNGQSCALGGSCTTPNFTSGVAGLVPASGGSSTSLFLTQAGTFASAGTSSPLTTKGDLYVFDTGNARLPVGTDGQVLTADSTQTKGVKWAAAGGAAGTGNGYARFVLDGAVVPFTAINGAHYNTQTMTLSAVNISALNTGSSGTTVVQVNQYRSGSLQDSTTASLASNSSLPGGTSASLGHSLSLVSGDVITVDVNSAATAASDLSVEWELGASAPTTGSSNVVSSFRIDGAVVPFTTIGTHYQSAALTLSTVNISAGNSGSSGSTVVQVNQYRSGSLVASATASLAAASSAPAGSAASLSGSLSLLSGDVVTVDVNSAAAGAADLTVEWELPQAPTTPIYSLTKQTTNYSVTDSDDTVIYTGTSAATFTLKSSATAKSKRYILMNNTSQTLSITLAGGDAFQDGSTSGTISPGSSAILQPDGGTTWYAFY